MDQPVAFSSGQHFSIQSWGRINCTIVLWDWVSFVYFYTGLGMTLTVWPKPKYMLCLFTSHSTNLLNIFD